MLDDISARHTARLDAVKKKRPRALRRSRWLANGAARKKKLELFDQCPKMKSDIPFEEAPTWSGQIPSPYPGTW